jgi:eukaryotic-like serine/threonine-protein kinase
MSLADAPERQIANRYVLRALLGRGGMGSVWRAYDTLLHREVAIKEIGFPAGLPSSETHAIRARAMREARSAASLSNPHVVTIFDVVQEEERGYIVMEFVGAPTLADVVHKEGSLPPERAAEIGLEVLTALQAAHDRGIVHRDVKPANVMIPEGGSAKLADFGIASVKDDAKITATGIVLGSPQFMAPEQASGAATGPQTDLWALGATLYFAVENDFPFDRGETIPTLAAVVHDPPREMIRAGGLEPTIEALLAKDPSDRPDPATLRRNLEQVATPVPSRASAPRPPESPIERAPERSTATARPRRSVVPFVAILLVLIAGAAIAYIAMRDEPEERAGGGGGSQESQDPVERGDAEGSGGDARPVPTWWVPYEVEGGFRIEHPPGWEITPSGDTQIDVSNPRNGTYLRVAWTDTPGPSAVDAWETQAESFGATHDDYEEIQISPTTFKGSSNAAIWEFTYSEGGADLHAVDLGFVLGDYGYALNFQTHAENWESSQDLFRAFKASFQASN